MLEIAPLAENVSDQTSSRIRLS